MNSLQAQIIVEEAREAFFAGEAEVANALEICQTRGNAFLFEKLVDSLNHVLHPVADPFLQLGPFRFEMLQHGFYRGERQRMTHESAGKECDADFGEGIIAETPGPAVERVHKLRFAG